MRAYRSASGGLCLQPGRYDGRAFGHLGAGGALEADPIDESGSCADLTREPMTAMLIASPARKGQPGRTVLIGATAPGVTDVAVTLPGGSIRHPVPGPRGTFVVPIAGFDPSPGFRVEATLPDGSRVRRDL